MKTLFPRGIAVGDAFYDRVDERARLKKNIEHGVHTVLIAPRRFGKTSLMMQVIFENHYPHLWFDLMTMTSVNEIQQKLINKMATLIVELSPKEEKIKTILTRYFRKLKPKIILSVPGISIEFQPEAIAHQGIVDALMELDKLVAEMRKRIVIVLDEFQEIVRLESENTVLQASIRHAAERSSAITYLFSGSKHRPLRKLFSEKNNPLYELCDIMTIERIDPRDYKNFINKAAKKKWGYTLNDDIIDRIVLHTDCYPKYVNALCSFLWNGELSPSVELVDELWKTYLLSKKTDITDEIGQLTLNQKRVVQYLAFNPTVELYNKETLLKLNLSQSSIQGAIEILLNKGIVAEVEGKFRVLDPAIRAYFHFF